MGLPVPEVICRVLAHVVGERTAERLAVSGALLGPAEALRCGLVDELAPVTEVVPRALAWLDGVLGRAPAAVAATRRRVRQPLFDAFATVDGALIETMLESWFFPETQARHAGAGRATGARAPAGYSRPMTLAGKTLFITGATRGIGKAIALRAARDGANVAVVGKTAAPHPKLPGTVAQCGARRSRRRAARRSPASPTFATRSRSAAAVAATVQRFGGIDVLVNNASAISLTRHAKTPNEAVRPDVRR